ncbi:unnamed protein product [Tenebrio molitor]|nr:unnamed protein product [Tenebrio molitor]
MDELFNIINIDDILCGAYLTPAFIISYRYKATFPIVAGLFLIFHAERRPPFNKYPVSTHTICKISANFYVYEPRTAVNFT